MTDLDRTKVTFEQAEGLEPLPSQLKPKEMSQALRSGLWHVLHTYLSASRQRHEYTRATIQDPWRTILFDLHVHRDHLPADEFRPEAEACLQKLKAIVLEGSYGQVFGLFQWLLRHPNCPQYVARPVEDTLKRNRAGYRLIDGRTFMPIASEEEAEVATRAFAALNSSKYAGTRMHLAAAAERLSTGDAAGSVREGMQAVEAVARIITEQKTFGDAPRFSNSSGIFMLLSRRPSRASMATPATNKGSGIRCSMTQKPRWTRPTRAAFVTYLIEKSQPRAN